MKRVVLFCAVLFVLAAIAAAPVTAATKLGFGLKAGASFSWSDDFGSEKMIVRPTFGVFALIELTPMLALQAEVDYLTTGEWWTDEVKIVETFNYLHIPVLLRARLMKEGKTVPFVVAGPAIGFLLSAKEAGEDVKQFFKSTDFGAEVGAGAEMALSNMKVVLEARFYVGFTNAYNFINLYSMKNRALSVTAGLLF
jgi:Outer membrane protein beta-barrel domain